MEKLKYLNSKLIGEAKQAVSGITLSNENYEVATNLLKERFGDQQTVVNSHYAELINLNPASNNTKSLRSMYDQVEKNLRCLKAGMNLRDWASNSKTVLSRISDQDNSNTEKMKILGLSWIISTDQMNVNVNTPTNMQQKATKRTALKQIASAFDPLGLFSPVILKGKVFLKKTVESKCFLG